LLSIFLWYLVISILGWLAFPLAFRLLPALADRGYAIARALGLLVWGYFFWLLASFGILKNDAGGLLFALLVLAGLSGWALMSKGWESLRDWLRAQWRLVASIEGLFFIAFVAMVVIRAANPEIVGTEKPMELAFINAILGSPTFPPHDPWLSGYSISYYYFGYVLTAMLAKLSNVPGGVAFNLSIASVFALSAAGVYGLTYNLLARRYPQLASRLTLPALLGPLFVLLVSNLEGFLHILHTRGLLWVQDAAGQLASPFWKWLDIKDLNLPPSQPFSWAPTQFWWWWRASRVIQDYDFAGNPREIINEFPFFSFLLSDLHPHVLAMPFAFLAIALALNVYLGGAQDAQGEAARRSWLPAMRTPNFLLAAVVLGGMAFLNTWDLPVYLVLFAAAYAFRTTDGFLRELDFRSWLRDLVVIGFWIGAAGVILYLPFYLGFSSQAGGPLPNLIYPTRGAHLWVMFGAFLVPLFAYLIYLYSILKRPKMLRRGFVLAAGFMLALWGLSLAFGFLITLLPELGDLYLGSLAAPNATELLSAAVTRRFTSPGGWITLLLLLGAGLALLLRMVVKPASLPEPGDAIQSPPDPALTPGRQADFFTLLLIILGTVLVVGIEFFYLRDQFGWRMNTIFKFYFQTWHIWALAAAYAVIVLLKELRGFAAAAFGLTITLVIVMALAYPAVSLWSKTNGFQPSGGLTLDGIRYLDESTPDETAAARWLAAAPNGVLAEAVSPTGGSYSNYARISMLSGLPAVLGWTGHESQWRGGSLEMGSRQPDLERLYCSRDWQEAKEILDRYQIRYIVIGGLERSTYAPGTSSCPSGLQEAKFLTQLRQAFQQGSITIYEYIPESGD
jgi:YYY domain-containing protein